MRNEEWNLFDLYNCEPAFQYECPRQWDQLRETKTAGVRFCEGCEKLVYFCNTPEEFVRQGELGQCVAIPAELTIKRELVPDFRSDDEQSTYVMGFVDYTPEIKARAARMAFWAEVLRLAPDLPHEPTALDDARLHIEQHQQQEIRVQKLMAEFEAERRAAAEAQEERRRKARAERERRESLSNKEAWGQAGTCPRCGLSLRWDGVYCAYCGKPAA